MWFSAILLLLAGSTLANLLEVREADNVECSDAMCVNGATNGTTDFYTLSTKGQTPGWMAMGFGTSMVNSPMVLIWRNDDGTFTLSQREAKDHVMPTVVKNPPRVATLDMKRTKWADGQSVFAFTIPSDGNVKPNIIWAFSDTNPKSSAIDASIRKHTDKDKDQIKLRQDNKGA